MNKDKYLSINMRQDRDDVAFANGKAIDKKSFYDVLVTSVVNGAFEKVNVQTFYVVTPELNISMKKWYNFVPADEKTYGLKVRAFSEIDNYRLKKVTEMAKEVVYFNQSNNNYKLIKGGLESDIKKAKAFESIKGNENNDIRLVEEQYYYIIEKERQIAEYNQTKNDKEPFYNRYGYAEPRHFADVNRLYGLYEELKEESEFKVNIDDIIDKLNDGIELDADEKARYVKHYHHDKNVFAKANQEFAAIKDCEIKKKR